MTKIKYLCFLSLQFVASLSFANKTIVTVQDLKSDGRGFVYNLCDHIVKNINEKIQCEYISPWASTYNSDELRKKYGKYDRHINVVFLNNDQNEVEISTEFDRHTITRDVYKTSSLDQNFNVKLQQYINFGQTKSRTNILYQGQKIIVDTKDYEGCRQVKDYILQKQFKKIRNSESIENFCDYTGESDRYKVITTMWESDERYVTQLNSKLLTSTDRNLLTETRNLSYLMAATMGLLWVLPESISKWDKEEIKNSGFLTKWKQNVSQKPVVDKDDFFINYVGHPISGAAYYTIARNLGYSKFESFGYSVMMSTFFWEYGVEALAERPSIQDLILTPVLGSLLGEMFYSWAKKIQNENNGEVLGSKKLGKVILFLLNPAGGISNSINRVLNHKLIKNSKTELVMSRKRSIDPRVQNSNYIGIQLRFEY